MTAQVTREKRFSIGDTVCTEGDDTFMGHFFMMVRRGTLECTKAAADGREVFLGHLAPGDTIDLSHVVRGEPIAFTVTCTSVVDVMMVASHEILPPKDSNVEPVIDKETLGRLVEREKVVPEGEDLDSYVDNQVKWTQ